MSSDTQAPEAGATVLRGAELKRVFVDGRRKLKVLRGVTIELRAGEIVSIQGRSGSGKSTLLHVLGLLDRPDEGHVYVNGLSASDLSEAQRSHYRARFIGFVFQHYFLLPEFTVLENLLMAARVAERPAHWLFAGRKEARKKAQKLLEQVELTDQANQYPLTLSGGERQRVALARALMPSPQVLLCDEPTGNLDPDTGTRIMRLVQDLSRREGVAVLVVTHDPNLAKTANRVLTLDAGKLRNAD